MLPLLFEHFRQEGVTSEMFLMDWMMSLFTKEIGAVCEAADCYSAYICPTHRIVALTVTIYTLLGQTLPLEIAAHIWDVYLYEGEMYLMCVALGILKLYAAK